MLNFGSRPFSRIIQWIVGHVELLAHDPSMQKKEDTVEILCNSRPVPPDINIATVLQQYWRASNKTLVLEFRVKVCDI